MKDKIIAGIITLVLGVFLFFIGMDTRAVGNPIEAYQVYLDGEKIGLIESKDELLTLIDNEQTDIKKKYNVDKVYPPAGLDVEKVYTYDDNIIDIQSIYNDIKDIEPFTIEGYAVTITYTEEVVSNDGETTPPGEPVTLYMLDKNFMNEALHDTAAVFIGTSDLAKYEDGTQETVTETGYIITSIYFDETITVKKDYVSTEDYIFTNVDDLSRYLLFGTLRSQKSYSVKEGDTLETIADDNSLNIEELLIANPELPSENVLLTAGDVLNVGLIDPLVSVVYYEDVTSDVTISHKSETIKDSSKYTDYQVVTQEGKDGVTRVTQSIKYINGEIKSLIITKTDVITAAIDEIVTRGTKILGGGYYYYDESQGNTEYSWPTTSPFIITSRYKWRWGRMHEGIDISGCGYGSPIYAVKNGVVTRVNRNSSLSEGLSVTIKHEKDVYTIYMHLSKILVSEGQTISKEQKIGLMGSSGASTGTHLHLGVYYGEPYRGGVSKDPCASIFTC